MNRMRTMPALMKPIEAPFVFSSNAHCAIGAIACFSGHAVGLFSSRIESLEAAFNLILPNNPEPFSKARTSNLVIIGAHQAYRPSQAAGEPEPIAPEKGWELSLWWEESGRWIYQPEAPE